MSYVGEWACRNTGTNVWLYYSVDLIHMYGLFRFVARESMFGCMGVLLRTGIERCGYIISCGDVQGDAKGSPCVR